MENNIKKFLENNSVCIVSTCNNNKPHAVPVYYFYNSENNKMYFVTKTGTKKFLNMSENNNVFVTIYRESPQATFTAECKSNILNCKKDNCIKITKHLIDIHSSEDYYPTPLTMLKEGSLALVELDIVSHKFNSYQKST